MKKKHIFLIILFAVIVGAALYFYFFYEKQAQEELSQFTNLSVAAFYNKNRVVTGYEIFNLGTMNHKRGKTLSGGSILEKLYSNNSYRISTFNLEDQNYYTSSDTIITNQNIKYRSDFHLVKPGEISVSHSGVLGKGNITILVDTNDFYQQVHFCMKYSLHIIKVDFLNFTQVENPTLQKNYDKCFVTNKNVYSNETLEIPFSIKVWGELNDDDFVKFVVMDSDFQNDNYITEFEGKDVGGENKEYIITI